MREAQLRKCVYVSSALKVYLHHGFDVLKVYQVPDYLLHLRKVTRDIIGP